MSSVSHGYFETASCGATALNCSWTLEKAISGQVSQVLRILRSLSGPHACGHSSRWSVGGRSGHLTVWEFMKRTKMTGRVFYLLRSIVHLMETTKTLEYLQWLLQQLSSFDLGSHGCDRVLMQMRHCSLCAGYPLVHPCPAFCEVSLARCLRPINKLQSSWTSLINTLYDQLQAWSNPTCPMIRNIVLHAPLAILEFHRVIMKSVQDEKCLISTSVLCLCRFSSSSKASSDCGSVRHLRYAENHPTSPPPRLSHHRPVGMGQPSDRECNLHFLYRSFLP
ncbi:unnamed protein product, partial [Hydatigera taeniaeformis]|uniref:Glypican-1 n=1 Tax=Hydatigena taeniaeformis TaxID=6205 RepID=A0A0R3WLN9_HYDTA